MIKAVTHDDSFDADNVMAAAILQLAGEEEVSIMRSRDSQVLDNADIVFDVGGVYDPANGKFDHNQNNSPRRKDGVSYSSASLLWREHNREVIENILVNKGYEDDEFFEANFESIWTYMAGHVDQKLLIPIDIENNKQGVYVLLDTNANGKDSQAVDATKKLYIHTNSRPFTLSSYLTTFNQPWWEEADNDDADENFFTAVSVAKELLEAIIEDAFWYQQNRHVVITGAQNAHKSDVPHMLALDEPLIWKAHIFAPELRDTDIKFVVLPAVSKKNGMVSWQLTGVPPSQQDRHSVKIPFPAAWGNLSGEKLQAQSNCKEALFCHDNLSHATFKTKEAALQVAQVLIEHGRVSDRANLSAMDLNIS